MALKVKLNGERTLYSLVELKEIRQSRLGEHLKRRSWEDLKTHYRQPSNFKNLNFDLKVTTYQDRT